MSSIVQMNYHDSWNLIYLRTINSINLWLWAFKKSNVLPMWLVLIFSGKKSATTHGIRRCGLSIKWMPECEYSHAICFSSKLTLSNEQIYNNVNMHAVCLLHDFKSIVAIQLQWITVGLWIIFLFFVWMSLADVYVPCAFAILPIVWHFSFGCIAPNCRSTVICICNKIGKRILLTDR